MKTVKYLEQIKLYDIKIEHKLLEREQLLTLAAKVNCSTEGERVQSSGDPDKVANAVVKIVEIDKEIDKMIDEFVELKREIIEMIYLMSDTKLMQVLYMKYIQYMSFEGIATKMKYSQDWIGRLHKRAIAEIESVRENPYQSV